ncbi:MAG TPA: glycosyltransferase family 87 protein [Thermoanaerobaculia bacterium]|nr:glycosyltransferase family 87 protein [Thermoanaerobaculia bacterium]
MLHSPAVNRSVRLALTSVTLFFFLFPLTLGKPGLPAHLKADESAYYLMALSLAHDGDLRLEVKDIDRLFREFPFQPVNNLILMTDDGWRTVYYGKPYIYSLFAVPLAGFFGANGLVAFNMLLLMAMVWMGTLYLRRFNADATAALFSAGFFLLSATFSYVFWIQPELFNMAAVAACLFFGLPREDVAGRRLLVFAALSGAAVVLAAYNKPMIAAVAVAPLWGYLRSRQWPAIGTWVLGALISLGAVTGIATALTGHPSSYLGVTRQGVTVCEPGRMPIEPPAPVAGARAGGGRAGQGEAAAAAQSPTGNSWSWLIRKPDTTWGELAENIGYFLWGRHTGFLLYLPFGGLAVALFLLHGRGSSERWLLLVSLAAVALFFLVFIAWNWQGGGGFVGNRYFINVYPGFLFLVTQIRPRWTVPLGYAAAGLCIGPLLFTPFGAGGPEPTLQSHVRNTPLRFFPLELSLRNVPGYERITMGDLRVIGRKDLVLPQGGMIWLRGASRVELYFLSLEPIEQAVFQVRSLAPRNRVTLKMSEARQDLTLQRGEEKRVELRPGKPLKVRTQGGKPVYVYKLVATPRTGRIRHWTRFYPPNSCPYFAEDSSRRESFFVGAELTYMGSGRHLGADLYKLQWGKIVAPRQVRAGETFTVATRLFNRSGRPWTAEGAARVNLSYHWHQDDKVVVQDGERTPLPLPVLPGGRVSVRQRVVAPARPGIYVLELDPVFENVAWFSDRNGRNTYRVEIEVLPAMAPGNGDVR